ncbi:MAG: biotin--[acetyl-CoA-carboxylase] ligase [Bacteroidota bacterium]
MMKTYKIDSVASTNNYARDVYRSFDSVENFCVVARNQHQGKGQMGASWISEPGKNLTASFVLNKIDLSPKDQFKLSALVSLNLIYVLHSFGLFQVKLKWPNDLLSNNKKICGILIENILKADLINTCIIGVGLNVNQTTFENLPQASSLKKLLGKSFTIDEILQAIAIAFEKIPFQLKTWSSEKIYSEYHSYLFRKKSPSMFQLTSGEVIPGIIQHVNSDGKLIVQFEDEIQQDFEVKEIKLLY